MPARAAVPAVPTLLKLARAYLNAVWTCSAVLDVSAACGRDEPWAAVCVVVATGFELPEPNFATRGSLATGKSMVGTTFAEARWIAIDMIVTAVKAVGIEALPQMVALVVSAISSLELVPAGGGDVHSFPGAASIIPTAATFIPKGTPIIPGAMSITTKATPIMPTPLELIVPPATVIIGTAKPTSSTSRPKIAASIITVADAEHDSRPA